MKAGRRHELKENDLIHALETGRAYLQQHGKGVGLTVVAVIAVVLATSFVIRSRGAVSEDHWRQKSLLSFEPDVAKQSLESLMTMADESTDQGLVLSALFEHGTQSLRLAAEAETSPAPEFNESARNAFEALLERFGNNPLAFAVAHGGLATVEENAFVVDGDLAHKERAREHLTAILDNAVLHATPFYRMALDRREAMETTFTQVVFAPALPPEEQPEEQPAVSPGLPIDITSQLRRIDTPEWAKDLPPLVAPTKEESGEADKEEPISSDEPAGRSEAGDAPPAEKPSDSPPDDSGTRDPDSDIAP